MSLPVKQEAIANAKSLEEVQHLEMLLKSGQIPGTGIGLNNGNGEEAMEDTLTH